MSEDLNGFTIYKLTRESDGHVVWIAAESLEALMSKFRENYPPNEDRWRVQSIVCPEPPKLTKIDWSST